MEISKLPTKYSRYNRKFFGQEALLHLNAHNYNQSVHLLTLSTKKEL